MAATGGAEDTQKVGGGQNCTLMWEQTQNYVQ